MASTSLSQSFGTIRRIFLYKLIIVFSSMTLFSCATIINTPNKNVHFYSVQDSVQISYSRDTIFCPDKIRIPRSHKKDTVFLHSGTISDTILLRPIVSPTYALNFVNYGIGYLVDLLTPKVTSYDEPIYIDLTQEEIVSTWRKPRAGTSVFSIQSPIIYSIFQNTSSHVNSGALEFVFDHFVSNNKGFYMQGSLLHRSNRHTILRSEIGFHAIVLRQFGIKAGMFYGYAHIKRSNFWNWNTSTSEIYDAPTTGFSIHFKRFLYRGLYSFGTYSAGYSPYPNQWHHIFEFGYGVSITPDFIKTKQRQ
ncbi:MAG: hypothetical protein PF481_11290 [Bacteroidales bacterium]|nr:hypothetical protein [Bacteroidales bacterium]